MAMVMVISMVTLMTLDDDEYDDEYDDDDDDQVGKVSALAFLLNGSEIELFLCEEGAVKITLARSYHHHDDNRHDHHPLSENHR